MEQSPLVFWIYVLGFYGVLLKTILFFMLKTYFLSLNKQ